MPRGVHVQSRQCSCEALVLFAHNNAGRRAGVPSRPGRSRAPAEVCGAGTQTFAPLRRKGPRTASGRPPAPALPLSGLIPCAIVLTFSPKIFVLSYCACASFAIGCGPYETRPSSPSPSSARRCAGISGRGGRKAPPKTDRSRAPPTWSSLAAHRGPRCSAAWRACAQFKRSSVICFGSGCSSPRSTRLTMSVSMALARHCLPIFSPSCTT